MDYGSILSRAWKITWNNKILWIFGFLAGTSGGFNFRSSGGGNGGDGGGFGPGGLPPEIEQFQRQLERPEVLAIVLAAFCFLILLAIAFFVLSLIARGGLVGGIRLADDNGKVTFGEAWAIGLRYFWRNFGLVLIAAAPILLFIAIALLVVFLTSGFGVFCILPLLCVLVIAYIPYAIVIWLGQIGVVVDDLGVFDSVRKGWELLKANVGPVIILGVILFVIGLVIGVAMLIPLAIIAIPVFFAFVTDPGNPNIPMLVGAGVAFLCLLPVLWVVSGAVNTWVYSVWTLTYRQFTGGASAPAPSAPSAFEPA